MNAHTDIVLSDDLLRSQVKYICLHVDKNNILAPRINKMEAWLEDTEVTTERLVHSELSCGDLEGRRSATAANAGAPHF